MEVSCVLCGAPGASSVTSGNESRHNIACEAARCGRYVITSGALSRLESGGPQKSVLIEMVQRANKHGKLLEIFVADDGLLQVDEVRRA